MIVLQGILFWLISLTWGGIMTAIGIMGALIALITGHRPYFNKYRVYFKFGNGWGGLTLGAIVFISKDCENLLPHEYGHTQQNLIFGPAFPFLIGLPSMLRYFIQGFKKHDSRLCFAICTTLLPAVLCFIAFVGGLYVALSGAFMTYSIFALSISGLLFVCFMTYYIWLTHVEIPQYDRVKIIVLSERQYKRIDLPNPDYDSIWFEGNATKRGDKIFKNLCKIS